MITAVPFTASQLSMFIVKARSALDLGAALSLGTQASCSPPSTWPPARIFESAPLIWTTLASNVRTYPANASNGARLSLPSAG